MTESRAKPIQDIEGLLAERRKYEQWLEQLEARKESTPGHVFVKVHTDYSARLDAAQQKLSAETGAIHAVAAELEESLAHHRRQIAERADERAEAELRAAVGEFAGKEWEKLRGKLDSAIADLSGERDAVQRELDTLRALLSEAEPQSPPPPEPPAAARAEPHPVEAAKHDVDDIAFLRSVLGRSTPYSSTPARSVPEPTTGERPLARPAAATDRRPTGEHAAPIAEAVTDPKPVRAPESPPAHDMRRGTPAVGSSNISGEQPWADTARGAARQPPPAPFSAPDSAPAPFAPRTGADERPGRLSGAFGQPAQRAPDGAKSLKCQECGTLNFPTEWYCERCGGELAAF